MTHVYLNDGNPLPADSKYAGQIGIQMTFDDGSSQNVYAADDRSMSEKLLGMYSNTRDRVKELKAQTPAQSTPTAPAAATTPAKLTAEQRLQMAADVNDPARGGAAIAALIKDETGLDLAALRREREEKELHARRKAVIDRFLAENPDFHPTPRNGQLLRDRVVAKHGMDDATAQNYADEFVALRDLGALESAPDEGNNTPQTPVTPQPVEPSAPAPARPTGTGQPSYRMGSGGRPATNTGFTREDVLTMDPSEFQRRFAEESGFVDKVNALFPNGI